MTELRTSRRLGARVMVVEDSTRMRMMLRRWLEHEGYTVAEAAHADDLFHSEAFAPHRWPRGAFDLLILDVCLPMESGIAILERLRTERWTTPAILTTAFADDPTREVAAALGVPLLSKPFRLDDLSTTARALLLSRGFVADSERL